MTRKTSRFLQLAGLAAAVVATGMFASYSEAANPKRSEAYFMTRAQRAAKVVCAKEKSPKRVNSCNKKQMAAARRIVSHIRRGDKERRLKKTLGCLNKVQLLPARLRRSGLLWVERCSR